MGEVGGHGFFYRSLFHEAIRCLPDDVRLLLYDAVTDYGIYGEEPKALDDVCLGLFTLIEAYIDGDRPGCFNDVFLDDSPDDL